MVCFSATFEREPSFARAGELLNTGMEPTSQEDATKLMSRIGRNFGGFMIRSIALAVILLLPDRLPSLIVLVGFWIPPAVAGWVAAGFLDQSRKRNGATVTFSVLAIFVLAYAAAWFLFNLGRMPPYIPGASIDPTFASPEAVAGLAVFTSALVLPGSALACALAFRVRGRMLSRMPTSPASD
ncbi:MAG TPA: hypothetical protein VFD48_00895 [Pyrinomonadaceae bacterium]|nr:hypothetical protein [Pyrinomonadaceae bacterium]